MVRFHRTNGWASVAAIAILAWGARVGSAGPVAMVRVDAPGAFSISAIHAAIDVDAVHGLGGGVNWVTGGTITEDNGVVNDGLTIDGTAQHVIAPHGELANPNIFLYNFTVNADNFLPGPNAMAPIGALFDHPGFGHSNAYLATLSFTVATSLGFVDDITSYTHVVTGKHTDSGETYRPRHGTLTGPAETGTVVTNAVGTLNLLVDRNTGNFDLTVAAVGIRLSDLIGAHIHLGPPGVDGPVIYDLDASSFLDAQGLGVVRVLQNAQFPQQHLHELLSGNTYVNLHTRQFPDGEIRGQLIPEPQSLALVLLAVLGGAFAGRCWAAGDRPLHV